jgi:hypothetical protein
LQRETQKLVKKNEVTLEGLEMKELDGGWWRYTKLRTHRDGRKRGKGCAEVHKGYLPMMVPTSTAAPRPRAVMNSPVLA